MLHGNTCDAASLAWMTNMTQHAPQRGFYLVMPDGVQTPGSKLRSLARSWNAGTCCGTAFVNGVDDVGFLSTVVDDLLGRFPIDRDAVFLSGSSNGGSMALRGACE
eukprot:2111027-Prymnesium_polylepis.1